MNIIRYLDANGHCHFASEQADGMSLRIEGDIYGDFTVTNEHADVVQILVFIDETHHRAKDAVRRRDPEVKMVVADPACAVLRRAGPNFTST